MKKALVMLSGGTDSATAVAYSVKKFNTSAIFFDYGQRAADYELGAARSIARHFNIPLEVADVSGLKRLFIGVSEGPTLAIGFKLSGPGSTRGNCPHGLFGVASTYCVSAGIDVLLSGMHAEDVIGLISPDNYFQNWGRGISELQSVEFEFGLPYLSASKADVIKEGAYMNVPFQNTRSCDQNLELHCGACGPCLKRKAAFSSAGVADPTQYLAE